jgi:hypothetical protein
MEDEEEGRAEGKEHQHEDEEAVRPANGDEDISRVGAGDSDSKSVCRSKKRLTSERMRRMIQRVSMKWIGVKLNISAWRQIVTTIARQFLPDKLGFEGGDEDLGGNDDFDEDNHEGDSVGFAGWTRDTDCEFGLRPFIIRREV